MHFKFAVLSLFYFIYNESLRIIFLRRCGALFGIISDEILPSAFDQLLLSSRHKGKPSAAMPDAGEPHVTPAPPAVPPTRAAAAAAAAALPRLPALARAHARDRDLACARSS